MDTDGEIWRKRALDAERLLNIAINFIADSDQYDKYQQYKTRYEFGEQIVKEHNRRHGI